MAYNLKTSISTPIAQPVIKKKFYVCHLSELVTLKGTWLPVCYFQRPANHNKFDFDSEGGLFKLKYFQAARNPKKWDTTVEYGRINRWRE